MESNYKPSIVSDVQRSIGAMNGIVVLLQGYQGSITSSEHIERNYPQVTLGQFLTFSSTVVEVCFSPALRVSPLSPSRPLRVLVRHMPQ